MRSGTDGERLEDRQMMAGDIRAYVRDGTLHINEAFNSWNGSQAVAVFQQPNGSVLVQGQTSPDNTIGSLVNGSGLNSVFTGVQRIEFNLGDGADHISLFGIKDSHIYQSVVINTTGSVLSQNDNDTVFIRDLFVFDRFDLRTGAGKDSVQVFNTQVSEDFNSNLQDSFNIMTGVITASGPADSDKDTLLVDGLTTKCITSMSTGATTTT